MQQTITPKTAADGIETGSKDMAKKWCVWDCNLDEVFLRQYSGRGYEYQEARSLAVAACKKYGGKYEPREEPEE